MRKGKKTSDNTIGLCVVCEQYAKNGHYKLRKIGDRPEPVIVCDVCSVLMGDNDE